MSLQRISTGRLTSDTSVVDAKGVLYGLLIETDGVNDATVTIYDNTAASGKILRKMTVPGADFYGGFELPAGLVANHGIYADVSGTNAAFWVTYGRG